MAISVEPNLCHYLIDYRYDKRYDQFRDAINAAIKVKNGLRRNTRDFTIIGAGNMGREINNLLLSGGNSVVIMDWENAEAQKLAEALRSDAKWNVPVSAVVMGTLDGVILACAMHCGQSGTTTCEVLSGPLLTYLGGESVPPRTAAFLKNNDLIMLHIRTQSTRAYPTKTEAGWVLVDL